MGNGTTTGGDLTGMWTLPSSGVIPCPCCGYCPTCGRRNFSPAPYMPQPWWPYTAPNPWQPVFITTTGSTGSSGWFQ